jgi:hypothetical protein
MFALTQQFTFDFLSNLQVIQERSYQGKLANLHYQKFTKTKTSASSQEILAWLISTARLKRNGQGGNVSYGDLAQVKQTYVNGNFADGLKLSWNQMSDLDGHGVDLAGEWNRQIGADIAYFPQREIVKILLNGETGTCYDSKAFFATDHPVHPLLTGLGTYSNLFTDLPISAADVSVEVALDNLNTAIARINQVKMPNGVDPRFLTVQGIIHPPAMRARVKQLTNAKFIAQNTSGAGGGSGDVEAVVTDMGFGDPICMAELASTQTYSLGENDDGTTVSGDDNDYYILCREVDQSELGAMVWINREPVTVTPFTPFDNDKMAEERAFKWIAQGRGVAGYGLPYFLFKCKNS